MYIFKIIILNLLRFVANMYVIEGIILENWFRSVKSFSKMNFNQPFNFKEIHIYIDTCTPDT